MAKRPRAPESSDEEEIGSSSAVLNKLYESAKAETNRGLRGKPKTTRRKNSPRNSSAKKPMDNDTIETVGQVAVVSCGLELIAEQTKRRKKAVDFADTHQPVNDTFPTRVGIQRLRARSQAVIDRQAGIQFRTDWKFPQVDAWVRELLPEFAQHLDSLPPRPNPNYDPETSPSHEEFLPNYFLCTKDRKRLVLVPGVTFFTGSDISFNVEDPQKRNFKYKTLVFCTLDEFDLTTDTTDPYPANNDDETSDGDYMGQSKHLEHSPHPEPGPSQPRTRRPAPSACRPHLHTTSLDLEIEKEFIASTAFLK